MVLQIIYGTVIWIIVPTIVASIFFLGLLIIARSDDKTKVSARAGFLAGLLIFVIYVVSRLSVIQTPQFGLDNLPNFDFSSIFLLLIGGVLGFFLLWGVSRLIPTRYIGIMTLFFSATSLSALFIYLFDINSRYTVMYFAIGMILGILVHTMFFPESFEVLQKKGDSGFTMGIIAILTVSTIIFIWMFYAVTHPQ